MTKFASTSLRSTSLLALTLSFSASAGWSQTVVPACDAGSPVVPCVANDQVIETADDYLDALDAGLLVTADPAAPPRTFLVTEGEGEGVFTIEPVEPDVAVAGDAEPEETPEGVEDPAPEAEAEPAAEPEPEVEAVSDAEPEPVADPDVTPETEADVEAETEVEAEVEVEGAPEDAIEPETEAEVEPMEGEAATDESVVDAAQGDPLEEALEAELEGNAVAEASDADVIVNGETAQEGETPSTGEIEMEEPPTEGEEGALIDVEITEDEGGEAEELPEEVAPTPEETVEDAPTTAAAAAESGETGEAEVITEEVTEEDVRTADQDFETAVTGDAAATETPSDRGLSNFERAVLLGLGAVAIGSILDNGDEVVSNSGDRIVVETESGQLRVLKDDDVLLRQPGSQVQTEQFSDGSSRTVVTREDGSQVITVRSADGRVLRRALVQTDGTQVELFDDTQAETAVDVTTLQRQRAPAPRVTATATEEDLRRALAAELGTDVNRTFSLRQVRNIKEVRELAPVIELDSITFATASAAIEPDQARELAQLGLAIRDYIERNPGAVFLVEGHTDAVGNAGYNLALSDRRAETVALALTEYFDVPPANLITQGYGEAHLKVRTLQAEQANRRAVVRNITRLLR